jgi:hypothetical protein
MKKKTKMLIGAQKTEGKKMMILIGQMSQLEIQFFSFSTSPLHYFRIKKYDVQLLQYFKKLREQSLK